VELVDRTDNGDAVHVREAEVDGCLAYNPQQRLTREVFDLAKLPNGTDGRPTTLPSRLRPTDTSKCELERKEECERKEERLDGNIIANLRLVEDHFNSGIRNHMAQYPFCQGKIVVSSTKYTKCGWGFSAVLCCTICEYETPKCRFYEIETGKQGRGRRSAKINVQMAVALTKHPYGSTGVREIMAACDIAPPSSEAMRKTDNKVADAFVALNKEQLAKNRTLIKEVVAIRKGYKHGSIMVQTDASYTSNPKGRSFSQPATQAYGPLLCAEPGLESTPLALATVSKLCTCPERQSGVHLPVICQQNYPHDKPIGNAEFVLGESCGKELVSGGPQAAINAGYVITDGVGPGALFKGVNNAMITNGYSQSTNQDCSKHISSGLRRNMRKLTLESVYINGYTIALRKKKHDRLLDHISQRCTWEFRALQKAYKDDIGKLKQKCAAAKIGILGCIQGDRELCMANCITCYLHTKHEAIDRTPRCLPDSHYLRSLSDSDKSKLSTCMDRKLGENAVDSQRHNATTNRCEASHRTTQRSLPKNNTFARNFNGRAHSAMHSMSLGHVKSTVVANEQFGVANASQSPAFKALKQQHKQFQYFQERRKSHQYKLAKAHARLKSLRRRAVFDDFGHTSGCLNPALQSEHSYGHK
jgi:hypothetical protein